MDELLKMRGWVTDKEIAENKRPNVDAGLKRPHFMLMGIAICHEPASLNRK